ncbi:hypothetical protein JCM10213_000412 [Rhodosporidiobolus nylandii]
MVARATLLALVFSLGFAAAMPTASLEERQYGGFYGSGSSSSSSACATGVHIIVARASTEPAGEGIIGQVATLVKNQVPGSSSEAISYPATLYPYLSSEAQGVSAMTSAIESYAQRCPDSKIVLMGYSRKLPVVGDSLCGSSGLYSFGSGTGGYSFPSGTYSYGGLSGYKSKRDAENTTVEKRQLSSNYQDNVVAVVQMGDPTFVPGKSYDVGTSPSAGIFPRGSTSCFDQIASKIQSYCDLGDEFCARGTSLAVHLSYVTKYGQQAASFVVGKASA